MPRSRNPDRDKAFELYEKNNGNIENREIGRILNVSEKTISVWKLRDRWKEKINCSTSKQECSTSKRNRGAQPHNKNGKGGPPGNKKAEKYGFFSKYLPDETLEIVQEIETKSPLDILWDQIVIQYAAIIRAQKIMLVKSQDDLTKVLKRQKESSGEYSESWEKEYELQFAWDKQANYLQAQSRAMTALQGMIKQYDELLRSNLATEEQRLRIQKLKGEVDKLNEGKDGKAANIVIVDDIEGEEDES